MLSVDGDLTFSSGSRYEVGVDPAGGGIAGRLDAVTSTYAFLTPRLGYAADAVTLTLDRNDVRFSDVASSSNLRATSAALEAQTPGGVRLGMIGGHNRDRMRGQGQADVDSYHVGLYGGGMLGAVALRGGLAVARQDVAAQRFVAFARFADGLASRYRAMTSQMFGEAAWRIGAVEPFVTLAHVRLNVGRGQESGTAAALQLAGDRMRTSYATVGARGETQVALRGARLAVRGSLGWRHAFGDQLPVVQAALDGQRFAVAGLPIARNSLVGDVRLHGAIRDRVQLSLGYQGAMARGGRNHGMQAGLNWRF